MNLKESAGPIATIIAVIVVIGIIIFVVVKGNQPDSVNPNGPIGQPPGYAKGNVPAGQLPVGNMSAPSQGGPPGGAGAYGRPMGGGR
ncbi:hypothetical protein [Armatimonas sp.]|uniref:hypothetical protein n=1 Tax=Armatimonas sp. TaxID=1872638 RepID=UPI003750B224